MTFFTFTFAAAVAVLRIRIFLFAALALALGCTRTSNPSSSFVFVAAASDTDTTVTVAGWRNDLDWDDLASKLSPSASLVDTSFQNFKEECLPEFLTPSPSNHALIDQPSGMCLPHLLLGWEMSWPRPSDDGHLSQTFDQIFKDFAGPGADTSEEMMGYALDSTNPSLNLPSKVLFPAVASDVVVAVQFAKKNNVEISVKNSGHDYSGSSSKKNTLLLNMNRYVHYASDGVTDCDTDAALLDTVVAKDLSNQACLLSLAKNKSSLIRVGGGENFDKAYRAVIAANKAQEEYKYHLVGGAAGTVSPMGWTWQGGNAGTTGGRRFGMGVDQVLQVEMVLPNGHHVKFGPTEWEDASADGFIVPHTKVVSGVCRSNPNEQDEEKWIWDDCPEYFGIDFGDLWFAVKGGGGGTWGVVTSVYLQLHEYLPYNEFLSGSVIGIEECSSIAPKFEEFMAKYLMAPKLLNVTKEKSLACGAPDFPGILYCFGEEDVVEAWTKFLEMNNLTESQKCLVNFDDLIEEAPKSYPERMLLGEEARFPGKVPDNPTPGILGTTHANVLVPQSWLDESEENIKILLENMVSSSPYFAYGFATAGLSDQANSLSKAHRDAAAMVSFFNLYSGDEANFWSNLFPKMFDISDKTQFPPVFGSNHAGFLTIGPLKEDWTKPCPREWTFKERNEKCISSQEAIYGTELLSRLEAIKKAVDPQFMFNCQSCIGNNLAKAKASHSQDDELTSPTTTTQSEEPSDQPSGASHASTYTTVISAIALHLFFSILN